jgi:hypothetical protein
MSEENKITIKEETKIDIPTQSTGEDLKINESKITKYKKPKAISLTKNLNCYPYGKLMVY